MSQEADDETNYYEVEAILDKREFSTGVAEYLIKWKGYSEEWINAREKNREARKKTKTQKVKKEKRRKSTSISSSKSQSKSSTTTDKPTTDKSATISGKRKASDDSSEAPKSDQGDNAQADSSKDSGIMHYTKVKRARHTQPKVAEVNIDAILKNIESNRTLTTNQQASTERFKSTLYKNTTSSLASSSNNNLSMDKSKQQSKELLSHTFPTKKPQWPPAPIQPPKKVQTVSPKPDQQQDQQQHSNILVPSQTSEASASTSGTVSQPSKPLIQTTKLPAQQTSIQTQVPAETPKAVQQVSMPAPQPPKPTQGKHPEVPKSIQQQVTSQPPKPVQQQQPMSPKPIQVPAPQPPKPVQLTPQPLKPVQQQQATPPKLVLQQQQSMPPRPIFQQQPSAQLPGFALSSSRPLQYKFAQQEPKHKLNQQTPKFHQPTSSPSFTPVPPPPPPPPKQYPRPHPAPMYPQQQLQPRLSPQRQDQPKISIINEARDPRLKTIVGRDPRIKKQQQSDPKQSPEANGELLQHKDLEMDVVLFKGDKEIAPITLKRKQKCYHRDKIIQLINAQAKGPNQLHIISYLPLRALNEIIHNRCITLIDILMTKSLVSFGKLRSFLQVNEIAGLAYDTNDTKDILVLLPVIDLHKLTNVPSDHGLMNYYHQLCAIYIEGVPEKPKVIEGLSGVGPLTSRDYTMLEWELAAVYLRFPPELKRLRTEAKFFIYGNSHAATLLAKALNATNTQSGSKSHVMMFDRYNKTVFTKNLIRHKKEPSTQIWEFGVPDLSTGDMLPPEQVFPNYSGGFITTDAKNIIHRPEIIDDISEQVARLNADTIANGKWKFVLPHNFFVQMKNVINNEIHATAGREAVVKMALAMSEGRLDILRVWSSGETQEKNSLEFMDNVAHNYYKEHQFFIYVDDIDAIPVNKRLNSIDFVTSANIYSSFALV
ncbi:hypothetical protein BCV72DRAFT_244201 [Rhizopus microsporus var. microsporus]|uniref:Chromo domain-containing protein n=1 Tax=Rhizopus microsporus var. microsporus TaxID=86635 RepID=A0A1X0QVA9_RHIZD|nr:hypothetical protein BCV72DRAFT_244201 [Rhizopus microsporus var. microsporus]